MESHGAMTIDAPAAAPIHAPADETEKLRTPCAERGGALETYAAYYEALVTFSESRHVTAETRLRCVEMAARFALLCHPGRYADGAIENVALTIGQELEQHVSLTASESASLPRPKPELGTRRRVLHISRSGYEVGGPPRNIRHWIRNDPESRHCVVLTRQGKHAFPSWYTAAMAEGGAELVVVPDEMTYLAKALWLRKFARSWADVVVLHEATYNAVPVAAFATEKVPPLCMFNHADHGFWMGSSVTDGLIDYRETAARISRHRRFALHNMLLPMPMADRPPMDRREARAALGIPFDQVMLLSIGLAYKFRPAHNRDFFQTMRALLDQIPEAHLYIVGVNASDAASFGGLSHPRIHLCGVIEEPWLYRHAADLYLDSFPFGGTTTLLETALIGVPVVTVYAPVLGVLSSTFHHLQGLVPHAADESEYIGRIKGLVRDPVRRAALGEELRAFVRANHVGDGWRAQLKKVYSWVDGRGHHPRAIPIEPCRSTPEDRALAEWEATHYPAAWLARSLVFGTANAAWKSGDHRGALAILARYTRLWGFDTAKHLLNKTWHKLLRR